MRPFLGSFTGRLDKKGRVSVPASFRAGLGRLGTDEIVLRPSHLLPCIEAWPQPTFDEITAGVDRLDGFSMTQSYLAHSLFSDAAQLRPDAEGRVILPEDMIAHAGLGEEVRFVGLGSQFQLWEPAAHLRYKQEAIAQTRERNLTVPAAAEGRA